MTFNIKNSRDFSNPKNIWVNRKIKVLKIIRKYNPDIIGLQEVYKDQLDFLSDNLPEYRYEGVGRNEGIQTGEFNPIFYRELKIQNSGTFWLSDTPDTCSNTWGGSFRICTWINFNYEIPFAVYNTHLENTKSTIRLKSIPVIIKEMEKNTSDRSIILTGDFNFKRNSKEYNEISKIFCDAYEEDRNNTFNWAVTSHEFKGTKKSILSWKGREVIDYIWLKGSFNVKETRIIHDNPGGSPEVFPSDHWPVMSDLSVY